MSCRPDVERTQTGVRIEKRLLKVCKAMAELYDLSLAEFFEDLVRDASPAASRSQAPRIYGLDPSPAPQDAPEAGA